MTKPESKVVDVVVIGAGTGGTSAAIQSARSGASTVLLNPIVWLGGMTTAAGVSATDGNHQLPAGLWGEFRDSLRQHYGGADSLFTGWVSNTMFEPKAGAYFWRQIADNESNLKVEYEAQVDTIIREDELWKIQYYKSGGDSSIYAKIIIDGTDLGDVAAMVGATYDIGMDARTKTGESMAPSVSNDLIQDLTYAAILKDYGPDADRTIKRPEPYDPSLFYCSCEDKCTDVEKDPHPCLTMLNYGKLPNGKYMINWPLSGNDYYVNSIDMNKAEREIAFASAKQKTLQFIYYIQTELGYKNLGIADDEFPTSDGLPLMPYHREGRRIHGLVQLTVNSIIDPYSDHLYRTGIAVGDYPIDHHHFERSDAPEIDFPKVPSFSIPMGSLIPKDRSHILIADKAISVTNIVNGSSRLQPVVIQIGQAAGLMGAMSALSDVLPQDLDVRTVQQHLLQAKGYIMPFIDVSTDHPEFHAIQRVAASGLMRGHGIPFKWANQTWFYPDSLMTQGEFRKGWTDFAQINPAKTKDVDFISLQYVLEQVSGYDKRGMQQLEDLLSSDTKIDQSRFDCWSQQKGLTKADVALILDVLLQPFDRDVDIHGEWKQKL